MRSLTTIRTSVTSRSAARRVSTLVKVETDAVDPTVKILTLNQPAVLNAMTADLGAGVQSAVAELRQLGPSELRAVVVTGAGRAFSAGGDLTFLDARRTDTPTNVGRPLPSLRRALLALLGHRRWMASSSTR